MQKQKGFTLIELLVVIGIVAILSVVVILTINPAEILRQARDSNRVSDLSTLKSALSLYLSDVATPVLNSNYNTCWMSNSIGTTTAKCGWFTGVSGMASTSAATNRKADSTGWVPVNFTSISAGSPLGQLPVDPTNDGTYLYAYAATSSGGILSFELDARLESSKYTTGSGDMVTTDGGTNATVYETGTALNL